MNKEILNTYNLYNSSKMVNTRTNNLNQQNNLNI